MKKVSVIVPVYNCEAYIDRCLMSLMGQTYKNLEILLMVGFCSDGSLEKCISMQKKDERIIVVSRKDSSLGDARNYALKVATGEYVAYLDADDYYSQDYIEQMITPLEEDETIDISCCGYDRFEDSDFSQPYVPGAVGAIGVNFQTYLEYITDAAVWLKVFRRKWLLDNHIEMFDGCCEDQSLHFVLASLVKKVFFLKQPLYHYNIGNENSLVRTLKSRLDYADAVEYAIKYLEKQGLFEKNRDSIRNKVCYVFQSFLQETYYHEELVSSCKRFLEKYFPETIEDYEASQTKDTHLKEKVVMYGAGADAEVFLKKNGPEGISYIVDRNEMLHGSYKHGLQIRPIQELYEEEEEVSVIVSSSKYYYEIVTMLRKNKQRSIFTPREYCNERKIENMLETGKPNILLFNVPAHANIGDHMIAEAEKIFFEKHFPEYHFVEVTNSVYNECHRLIHNILRPEDVIIITGGGFLGSLWIDGGEDVVRRIMREYRDRKIVVFPQSIFFEDTEEGERERNFSCDIYNECKAITLFLREDLSYHRALSMMHNPGFCHLVPDIVLSMTKSDFVTSEETVRGNKGAICLKNCKESRYGEEEKAQIIAIARRFHSDICFTSMYAEQEIDPNERKRFIEDKLMEISNYKFMITDALHCMISCAIVGTPCVAFDNISGKVRGVYEWIRHLPYIQFVDGCEELQDALQEVLQAEDRSFRFDYSPFDAELEEAVREQDIERIS